jgi:hypothetical protein
VQAILEYKWHQLKWQAYVGFMFQLFYIIWIQFNNSAVDPLVFASMFFIYWSIKVITYPEEARTTVFTFWGIVELLRIVLLVLYAWHNF